MRFPDLAVLAASVTLTGCWSVHKRDDAPPPAPVTTTTVTTPVESRSPSRVSPEASPPVAKKQDNVLAAAIGAYDNGDYAAAQQKLQAVLDQGSAATTDRVTAHKLLAFIACADGKRTVCAQHFRQALALDRSFALTPAEAGHPVWGPVFRKVKAEKPRKGTTQR